MSSGGSWLQFGNTTNKFKSSYVRGFLDVCGNIQVRQGGLTMSHGDISCNGDVYINRIRDHAGNIIVSSGGSGTVIDDTTNLTINSLTEVKTTSRLTGNVGIGKASTSNALDISGNLNVVGNSSIAGTQEILGANISIGKALDANYNLDVNGNVRSSGDIYIQGSTIITNDASITTDASSAMLYIKDTRTDISNNIIMDAPNAVFKSVVNGNLNRTAHLEIDTTNRRILPFVKDASGNNIDVSGSVVDGWELGGPGPNRFDKIYARDVKISTNTLLIEDDAGNQIGMSFDAATGAVNYNVTTLGGEQFTIKGVQTQKISSGGGTIDPSLLEFTGLAFGDTFDCAAVNDLSTTYTYNLSTTTYTPNGPSSFSTSAGPQNLNDFLSITNKDTILGSMATGDRVVIRSGTDTDRTADNFLAPIEDATNQTDKSNLILIVKKKTSTDLEWTLWGTEIDNKNNEVGNYLNYIELKNINMASGTYFIAKTDGNIVYNISNTDLLTTDDLTGVVNGDLFLYVSRGSGNNWTKIPVSLPQTASIDTQHLADQAVKTTKLGLLSVTKDILASNSVSTDKIESGAITADKIGVGAISAGSFGDGSISGVKITTGTIPLDRLDANALTGKQDSLTAGDNITIIGSTISATVTADVVDGSITNPKLALNSVQKSNIAAGAVTSGKLSSITDADGAAVDYTKLADNAVIERTIANNAVIERTIANNAITTSKILNGNINSDKLATSSVTVGKIAPGAVNVASIIADGVVTGAKLHIDAVDSYITAGSNVTLSKNTTTGIVTIASSGGGGGGGGTTLTSTTDVDVHDITVHGDISGNAAANFNILKMNNLASHIIPTINEVFDLGSASYKIRHLFLSSNSLWMGDDNKMDITDGTIKFKKRIKDKVPSGIAGGNLDEAKSFLAGIGRTRNIESDFTLDDWQQYAKIKGVPHDVGEIYLNADIEESLAGNIKQW
jgi:hypothetical protein